MSGNTNVEFGREYAPNMLHVQPGKHDPMTSSIV